MKKIISFICILFLVGCSKEKYITCNLEVDNNVQNYNLTGVYKIYYNRNFVTKIEEQEIYISNDKFVINYFREKTILKYYYLNDLYGGIEYQSEENNESFIFNSTIDMSSIDIKKMLEDKYLDKDYIISNKLTTSGIVKIYESKGAVCDI